VSLPITVENVTFSTRYNLSSNSLVRKAWWGTRYYPFDDIRYIHERIKLLKSSIGRTRLDPKRQLILEMKNGQLLTLTIDSPQREYLAIQLLDAMQEKFVKVGKIADRSVHQQGRTRDKSLLIFTIRGFSGLLIFPVWINLREGEYLNGMIFFMLVFLGVVAIPRVIKAFYKWT